MVENANEFSGNEFIEAIEESVDLLWNTSIQFVMSELLHIFEFVLIVNHGILAIGDQLHFLAFAEEFLLDHEVLLESGDVVFETPLQVLVELVVVVFHVFEVQGLAKDDFVEWLDEVAF